MADGVSADDSLWGLGEVMKEFGITNYELRMTNDELGMWNY